MKYAQDFMPWKVMDISFRPYDGLWSMNPSIHFDGSEWRCVLRCTDYAMPNGVTIRSEKARPAGNQTKNAMVVLDPVTWKAIKIHKMQERDGLPRAVCANVGFEDMRIFKTDRGGLQGIAASLHLQRDQRPADGGAQNQPPEQVLLSFDEEYNIVGARPIRGDWWSGSPQKNWVPFDHCAEPRFLYSIDRGTMFDDRGSVHGDGAAARPSTNARSVPQSLTIAQGPRSIETSSDAELEREREQEQERAREREQEQERAREREREKERESRSRSRHPDRRVAIRGGDVQLVRGRKIVADALSSRPSIRSGTRHGTRGGNESTRVLGTGRTLPPKYEGLRGGTQLSRVGEDAWLGLAHEMRFVKGLKWYWHTWYLVDSRGRMTATSAPMKLAQNGIEFAAGMAIDGDRLVVSFGVDDMECRLGETKLSSVLGTLRAVER